MTESSPSPARRLPPPWVFSTYFAEGFPYSLVNQISTVYFKDHGASLQAVGLTALFRLPWVLKALWAPLADAFATKRFWLLMAEGALVAGVLFMALASASPYALALGSAAFLVMAFLAATHDIAIDGYYLEALEKKEQARYVGYQAMAYRIALIAGGGGVTAFSGLTSWGAAFVLSAAILAGIMAFHWAFLPRSERSAQPAGKLLAALASPRRLAWMVGAGAVGAGLVVAFRSGPVQELVAPAKPLLDKIGLPGAITLGLLLMLLCFLAFLPYLKRRLDASDSFYARAFVDYLDQPRIGVLLFFISTYRTGESFLLAMVYPLLKDIGIDRALYGVIYGTFGIAASIVGGILGGYLIGKIGLRRAIWPLVLAQNVPHLLYMGLALMYRNITGHPELGSANHFLVTAFVVMEAFGAGMGTSVFMVYSQRTCKKAFKAAHYSIASSIWNVSSTLAGVLSGFLAAWLGWPLFYAFTFLVTLPSMAAIFWLPHLDE